MNYPKEEIDPLILPAVEILNKYGFKTFESCQGGDGHCFPQPIVRFEGNEFDLIRAYEICQWYNLYPSEARRVFRKNLAEKDEKNPDAAALWDKPFNEIVFFEWGLPKRLIIRSPLFGFSDKSTYKNNQEGKIS